MTMYCHNCGRQLEDGELLSTDGCAYCVHYYDADKDYPTKSPDNTSSNDTEGSLIGSAIGLLLLAGFLYLLYKLFF